MNKLLRFANKIVAWYAWYQKLPYVRASAGSQDFHAATRERFASQGREERYKPFGIVESLTNKVGVDAWRTRIGRHDQDF